MIFDQEKEEKMLYRVFTKKSANEYLYEKMTLLFKEGKKFFLIVPEQFTVEAEKELLKHFGNKINMSAEVCNFSRLPNRVFREIGGISEPYVNTVGKSLIIARIFVNNCDKFKRFKRKEIDAGFCELVLNQVEEFINCGITPSFLEFVATKQKDVDLQNKLYDLSIVLSEYRRIVKEKGGDFCDDAMRLEKVMEESGFFSDCTIFIDGFYDFTHEQLLLISRMTECASDVYVTLKCKKDFVLSDKDVFVKGKRTANILKRLARSSVFDVEYTDVSNQPKEIVYLSENLIDPSAKYDEDTDAIKITSCKNTADEVKNVARKIRKLVMDGEKYSDMAVVFRDESKYAEIAGDVFSRYDIPVFINKKERLSDYFAVRQILKAVEICQGDLSLRAFREYIKSGILNVENEELFALELYAVKWNINGEKWFSDFKNHPDGFGEKFDENSNEILRKINETREKIVLPIKKLRHSLTKEKVCDKIKGIVDFLKDVGIDVSAERLARKLESENLFSKAVLVRELFSEMISALKQMNVILGELNIGKDFLQYLTLSFSYTNVGKIPQSQDKVEMGEIGFLRLSDVKYLFILGVNDGVFPKSQSPHRLLSDKEKEVLENDGLVLNIYGEDYLFNEYFYLYETLLSVKKEVNVSYVFSSFDSAAFESIFVKRIKNIFPSLKTRLSNDEDEPICREELFDYLCKKGSISDEEEIQSLLLNTPDEKFKNKLALLLRARDYMHSSKTLKAPLFEGNIEISQTRLEKYSKCKYSYFLEYVLKLEPQKSAAFEARNIGNLVHAILEKVMIMAEKEKKPIAEFSKEEIKKFCRELTLEYVNEFIEEKSDESARMNFTVMRIEKAVTEIIENIKEELSVSEFLPVLYEATLKTKSEKYELTFLEGRKMILDGKIDRIDLYTDGDGVSYVRIIDYKTGDKEFKIDDVYNGINFQLLVYLFAVCKGGLLINGKRTYPKAGGVLYFPVMMKKGKFSYKTDSDKVEKNLKNSCRRSGLILGENDIRVKMEGVNKGKYITAKEVSEKTFDVLKKWLDNFFIRLIKEMDSGDISAFPLANANGDLDTCKYCDYKVICKNTENRCRPYKSFDSLTQTVLAMEEE